MRTFFLSLFLLIISTGCYTKETVTTGMDQLFTTTYSQKLKNKKVGLVTNHTGLNRNMKTSVQLILENAKTLNYEVIALFGPEHGVDGSGYAEGWDPADIQYRQKEGKIPVYGLHGNTKRPTAQMLNGIDLLIFDIQDIGCRHYTYATTLFYVMEAAAQAKIPVIVTDRPNPINGHTVDGPMLEDDLRSTVGYVNVPLCHGMTIGELAKYFNKEHKANCNLTVIPMKGWKRWMSFKDTDLVWVPTSPQIPEMDTPFFYLSTAIIGEGLSEISTGVGYTLPFKIVGAPWINASNFSKQLNKQNFPGVYFLPFHFRPFFGRYKGEDCHGIRLIITDPVTYKPVSTQFLILGILKSAYPEQFKKSVEARSAQQKRMFNLLSGSKQIASIIENERNIVWKLLEVDEIKRQEYLKKRKNYLISSYGT